MAIQRSYLFPEPNNKIKEGSPEDLYAYLQEQNAVLKRMYEQLADGINGTILTDYSPNNDQWTPVLDGATTSDTFTYDHQIGWVFRQGIFVDIWFDIKWTAVATAAGNLFLYLPYKAQETSQKPFVVVVQASGITYTGGTEIVINAISDTYRGEFWNTGSGFTTANQSVVSSGQLIGHLRYVGQFDEDRQD